MARQNLSGKPITLSEADQKYYYALGRRKEAVATVRLYEGKGKNLINGKDINEVYVSPMSKKVLSIPFEITATEGKFYYTVKTMGGGKIGQLGALKMAIARALVKFDPTLRAKLKPYGLLTRDPRMVERKKTGLRKARKSPQYSKR